MPTNTTGAALSASFSGGAAMHDACAMVAPPSAKAAKTSSGASHRAVMTDATQAGFKGSTARSAQPTGCWKRVPTTVAQTGNIIHWAWNGYLLTIFVDPSHGKDGIRHVVNDTGGSSTKANPDTRLRW